MADFSHFIVFYSMATGHQAETSSQDYIDPFCDECILESGTMVKVNAFCEVCNAFMCEGCEKFHADQEIYLKHIILRGKDLPPCQKKRPVIYDRCNSHDQQKLDQFCERHSCLVCSECVKRLHKACLTEPVKIVSFKANAQEIGNMKTNVLELKKEMLSSQEYLDTCLRSHLTRQRDTVLEKCQFKFDELVAKIEHLRAQYEAEVDTLFEKQSKLFSEQIRDIEKVVKGLDVAYKCIEKAEKKYELESENLFIEIKTIVTDINQCTDDFRKIQNSFEAVTLKFTDNNYLHKCIMKADSIGSLYICPVDLQFRSAAKIKHIVFPQFGTKRPPEKSLTALKKTSVKP